MKLLDVLARTLLILSLLCNGMGSAYAMAGTHAPSAVKAGTSGKAHEACHHASARPHEGDSRHPAPKRPCCGSDWCACPCTGLAAIPLPAAFPITASPPAVGALSRSLDSGHAPPRLSNLLRPPIG